MSDATPGAAATYEFTFKTTADQASKNIQGVIVDFCGGNGADSPFIGDSNCTIPTSMTVPNSGSATGVSGLNAGTWSVANGTAAHILKLTNASATTNVGSNVTVTFTVSGFVNPSSTGIFYARIATFQTVAAANAYTSSTPGSYTDYGGIALTTTTAVVVTAKVQETLTFCLSKAVPTAGCAGADNPAVNLGDRVGTTDNYILTNSNTVYTGTVNSQLTTNALNGAVVRLKTTNTTACAGLSANNGTDTCSQFPAKGAAAAFNISGSGSAGFGMCVVPAAGVTVASPFSGANCAAKGDTTEWGLNNTAATTAAPNYGDTLYNTAAPTKNANVAINYGVMSVDTTPAGIYTTVQSMIATGTF